MISILTIIADEILNWNIKLRLSTVKIKSKPKWFIKEHYIEENENKLDLDDRV